MIEDLVFRATRREQLPAGTQNLSRQQPGRGPAVMETEVSNQRSQTNIVEACIVGKFLKSAQDETVSYTNTHDLHYLIVIVHSRVLHKN